MLLLFITAASAGPWVKAQGSSYTKVSGSKFVAGEYVDPKVSESAGLDYSSWSAVLYTEVGLGAGLQLHANLPYLWAANYDPVEDERFAAAAPGDALVGLNWQLPVSLPASVFIQSRLPMYADGDRQDSFPAMGDPQVDWDLQANVGGSRPWGTHSVWGIVEGGFRYRSAASYRGNTPAFDYGNGLPYRLQLGMAPSLNGRSLGWIQLDASGLVTLQSDTFTKQWHQAGVGVAVAVLPGIHLEIGAQRIYAARAASLGNSVSVGLSHQR